MYERNQFKVYCIGNVSWYVKRFSIISIIFYMSSQEYRLRHSFISQEKFALECTHVRMHSLGTPTGKIYISAKNPNNGEWNHCENNEGKRMRVRLARSNLRSVKKTSIASKFVANVEKIVPGRAVLLNFTRNVIDMCVVFELEAREFSHNIPEILRVSLMNLSGIASRKLERIFTTSLKYYAYHSRIISYWFSKLGENFNHIPQITKNIIVSLTRITCTLEIFEYCLYYSKVYTPQSNTGTHVKCGDPET